MRRKTNDEVLRLRMMSQWIPIHGRKALTIRNWRRYRMAEKGYGRLLPTTRDSMYLPTRPVRAFASNHFVRVITAPWGAD